MDGKADLHLHTTFSDGELSPRDLLLRARVAGLSTISITDHDHTGAWGEAALMGKELGIRVIPGVELSASLEGQEVHLLGYFFDPENKALARSLAFFREERVKRVKRILEKLHDLNVPLRFEAVLARAGNGSVGRPHIASAMVEEGLTETYQQAFLKYLGSGKPAYEQKYQLSPREAIALVSGAGGLCFVAHPGNLVSEDVLQRLIREGVDGIEVVHPSHSEEMVTYYRGIAEEYCLLVSGGSDFHGGRKNDAGTVGVFCIGAEAVGAMERRLHR
jgi:predicted metal-dependent phosphoesterase TrpH